MVGPSCTRCCWSWSLAGRRRACPPRRPRRCWPRSALFRVLERPRTDRRLLRRAGAAPAVPAPGTGRSTGRCTTWPPCNCATRPKAASAQPQEGVREDVDGSHAGSEATAVRQRLPDESPRRATAIATASTTSWVLRLPLIDEPTTRREYTSSTTAKYSQPASLGHVDHVGHPQLIGAVGDELAVHQVPARRREVGQMLPQHRETPSACDESRHSEEPLRHIPARAARSQHAPLPSGRSRGEAAIPSQATLISTSPQLSRSPRRAATGLVCSHCGVGRSDVRPRVVIAATMSSEPTMPATVRCSPSSVTAISTAVTGSSSVAITAALLGVLRRPVNRRA